MLISSAQLNNIANYVKVSDTNDLTPTASQSGISKDTGQNVQDEEKGAQKNPSELSASERQQVTQLQQRDSEVRAHEAAHIAAGGSVIAGSASFTYQKGPDGKLYAIGGEVPISVSGGSTPEETIANARQVQAGALAPANPSPQDLRVAASAAVMEARARQELSAQKADEYKEKALQSYSDNQEDTINTTDKSLLSVDT